MSDAGLVHIVDDDSGIRAGLSSLVRSVGLAARQYGSAGEFLASELPPVPSCLLLDVRMPGTNGLDLQDSLRKHGIRFPVILMTGYGDVQMSVRGMKAGARGSSGPDASRASKWGNRDMAFWICGVRSRLLITL